MKTHVLLVIALATTGARCNDVDDDLFSQIERAKDRLRQDYLSKLWYGASEAISESQEKVLRLYTQYTIQQSQHVVEHIGLHHNITRRESIERRSKFLSTRKNATDVLPTLECLFANEIQTLGAYKMTGYNLHNCIRSAQHDTESRYLEIVENLNIIKNVSLHDYDGYCKSLDNCAEKSCVLTTLFRAIVNYEKLQEDVFTNVTEINNLSTRYVFSRIAMGCIAKSLDQVSENYKIGSDLAKECLARFDETLSADRRDLSV